MLASRRTQDRQNSDKIYGKTMRNIDWTSIFLPTTNIPTYQEILDPAEGLLADLQNFSQNWDPTNLSEIFDHKSRMP